MQIRLAGIIPETLVNGPGFRRVFFSQGCSHQCEGCFNPETWDPNGGSLYDIDEILQDTFDNPILRGVTFSGGDPFEQADKFAIMAKKIKEQSKLTIWCYTGYTYEELIEGSNSNKDWKTMLEYIDVLVDGMFEEENKKDGLKFKGSTNQRIINIQKSKQLNTIILEEV